SGGPVPTFSSNTIQQPSITVHGAGVFQICLRENISYNSCGTFGVGNCNTTQCELITIHQTNTEVIPSWTPIGPFCVDNTNCIDLDAQVTGNTGGVFKGIGVRLDPTHPNYCFTPSVAGVGTHVICYTVQNGAGCTAVECHNVVVYPTVSLACADAADTLQCATRALGPNTNNYGPHGGVLIVSRYSLGTHSLNALLCPTATRGGTWSYISGPASSGAVADGLLYFSTPGCYTVRYTVSSFPGGTGGCTATQDFTVHVGELPNPSFDLPDNVCWDQVNVVQFNIPSSFLTSPTYSGTVARTYRSTNTGVATVNAAGVVTVVGNGTTTICMEETITTVACGVTTTCRSEFCEVLRVQNNTTVVNPAWTAIGPFCIDQPCVLLAPLVTGTTGGIFTGQGVRPPGGALVHPNYEFCPAVAGVGIHAVTYTVNSPDGCTALLTRNIHVYPAANASLVSDSIVCQVEPTGIIDLTALFTPLTTGGGVFTKTGGPASGRVVGGNQFNYTEAGCYCFSYTVSTFPGATGACLATGTACLLITEQPTPNFDIQNERCWNITDPVALKRDTLRVNSPTYDPAGVLSRTLRVNSGPAVVIANGPTIFAVEYTGSGNVVLCFEEKLTYAACGTAIPAGRVCVDTLCRQISVQDGTALNATFTVTGAKTEYCPGDTITFTPVTPGGIFSGTNVGNSNPVGTNGGLRFTGCGVYVVTYSVETPAGCENVSSQTFFTDRTNPVFVGPLTANRFDTVVECDGASQTARMNAWAGRFTFTDNCQFRTFFKVFDRRSGCSPSTGLYVFEVTGRDTCGNETNVYPSYRVQDTTRPSFTTLPTDLVIECGNETDAQIINWLNINGRAIATDICSGTRLRWSHNFSGDIADYCSAVGTLVTFTVFDECNNSNNASARIIVRDQTPPIWNVRPQNLTLECDGTTDPLNAIQSWLGKNGDGVAIDSCQLTVRYTNNFVRLTGGCNRNTGSALVTFTASDACGNSVTAQATVAVRDIVAPQITSPAQDTTIFCSVANGSPANITTARTAWLNAMGRSVSFDQCDGKTRNAVILPPAPDFTSSTLMRTIQGCAAPLVTETWMFQYRDSCGNLSAGTIAEFRVRDTTAPVWSVNPANMIAECDRNGNPPNLNAWLAINGGGVLLVDDCNGTTRIEHDLVRHYDKCSNTDSMIYRFTAFDCSGNSSFREATFYIRDITAPVIDPASGYNKLTSCDQSNAGNDDDIVAWLDSFGGLRATDACSDVINWRHNFSDTRWVKGCGDTRTQAVTFTATDDCGNFANRTLTVGTVDTTKPVFFNCPRPPIVIAAETFHCDAYVNFSPMAAFDNCSVPTITQIDKTGLKSGDRFPVGTTILVFEAKDPCDNRDTCSLKIIVNDYWDVPSITCPAALTVNTAIDSCGISVISPSLKPTNVTDNCPYTTVTYQIKDSTGKVLSRGFTDASGSFFPVGKNTIDYCVYDQPILLISEVTQMFGGATTVGRTNPVPAFISANVAPAELIDGDFIEITNYGPTVIDLTCLSIEIVDAAGTVCTYVLPPKFPLMPMHFLAPGRVATFHVGAGTDSPANLFFNMNCTQVGPNVGRGYSLKLNDRNIDVVATNGFNPVGKGSADPITLNDWKGALGQQLCRGSYYRISHFDSNLSSDWELATSCIPATIGSLNKDHKFVPSNGDTVALQSILANVRCCSSTVTVLDVQAPECAKYDTLTFINPTNLNVPFNQGTCFKSTITVPNNCLVGDFRLLNLTGNSSENLGDWKVTLVSPSGTRILIWDNICPAATSFNLNVSELAAKGGANGNITSAPCVPNFGNGGFYKAQETMNSVYHERSNGIWTLELEDNSCSASLITNVLSNWRLQILCISPAVLRDTIVNADFRQCHKKFLWYHPVFNDNCKGGTMDVSFTGITQTTPCGTTLTPSDIPANKKNVPAGSCDSVLLSIGTTKFTYILTDRSGNTGMCMFSVTVRDVNAPVVTANKDITISSDPGDCGKFFNFPIDANDSCGIDSIWSVPANGSYFKGTTRVCVYARDKSCNIDSSCFNVTVNPYIPSSAELVCNDQLNLSLDQNCSAVLNADMILEGGNHYCYNDYIITVKDASTNVPHPNRFNYSDVGKCFIVTVTDPRSGNSCWGKVCIEDKQKPNIACPRDTIVTCISTIDPDDLGRPTLLTCEQSYTFEYHDDFTEYGECASPYVAEIQRNWIVVDESGNSDTCIQYIYIRRLDLADIKFPKNYDDITYPSLECQDKKYDKDVSQHITPYPECVDGYLLDSAIWKSSGGLIRVPRKLGWNFLTSGPNVGHPSPYPIYYDAHPQYSGNRLCWGPDQIVKWEGTGYPTIDGIDLSLRGRCAISMKYVDEVYEVCENSTDILREWSVRNMCLPVIAGVNPFKFIQNIKVLDKRGPEISYPDTLVITTDNSSTCKATWVVSPPWIKDNCSDSTYIIVRAWAGTAVQYPNGTWAVFNLPVGVHRMEIVAKDKCGNSTVKKISLSVVDGLPPVPICRTKTVVSVNGNLSPSENGAKIYAESFDEGSYDNCSPHVFFKTIRMADLLGTNNGSTRDNTVSCGGSNGDDDATLVGNQVYFDDYTRFCCEDVGKTIMVVLRVFDVDPGAGPINPTLMNAGRPLFGHFSDCMIEVEVQNKGVPTVIAPPNMVVSCWYWFDIAKASDPNDRQFGRVVTDLNTREKVKTSDIVCHKFCERNQLTGYPGFVQTNQVPMPAPNQACVYYNQLFDSAHWDRKYELVWGFDGYALSACGTTPTIVVNDLRECGQGQIQRIITAVGPNNSRVNAIQTIWVVDCDPFFIDPLNCNDPRYSDIQWPNGVCNQNPIVIDGCGADISPENPQLGKPTVVNNADDNCSLISIEHFDETFTIEPDACFKVLRKWVVIDWCQYDPFIDPNIGRWEALQIIKVRDQDKPVVTCNVGPCEPASIDPTLKVCVGHISLTATATDNCTPLDWLFWEYKIDAYNDGKGVHGGYDFRVGTLTQRQYNAGDTVEYSQNPFADDNHNPFNASGTYPIGIHKIRWNVEDGCGNIGVCETLFEIKDCKAPTPYCITGVITVPMPSSGCVDIWAKDLNLGSYDNCTPKDSLKFYFDGDENKPSIRVCCDDFVKAGQNDELRVNVEMWVQDEEGNKDYCKTVVIVQDNLDSCLNTGSFARIVGNLLTEGNEETKSVKVQLERNATMLREVSGSPYKFGDLVLNEAYTVKPIRNDDHLNGVSTADIVKIQKHILGQALITSPYKMIAADVNASGTVTASDISEIRKLILGVIPEFGKVQSWTFVPETYTFVDPTKPFNAPRTAVITPVLVKDYNQNFMAIKMGDLTGNAKAGLITPTIRTTGVVNLEIDEAEVVAGTYYKMAIRSNDFANIAGYQFTMNFDHESLIFEKVESGVLNMNETNVANIRDGILTTSWNSNTGVTHSKDEVLYTVVFKAVQTGNISKMITITSDVTHAEAYDQLDQLKDVKLVVRTDEGIVETGIFELYQNEPNPFRTESVIGYRLPEAAAVKLTIYDVAGKVVRVYELQGQKGLNQFKILKSELSTSSVLYYQLDAADHTATKRMLLVD
ncbi:MAG: HYR domain-containing protein, partial [Saprospiraceae bacterium]|nr:HYR domain-containing protein [Saprospiraceae bacterium]